MIRRQKSVSDGGSVAIEHRTLNHVIARRSVRELMTLGIRRLLATRGKRLAAVSAALVATIGLVAATPGPASASASAALLCSPPSAVRVKLYQNAGYLGGYWYGACDSVTNSTYHDGDNFNNGMHLYDQVTSLKTNTFATVYFFTNHYCTGSYYPVMGYSSISNVGSTFNDTFSSHNTNFSC